MSQSPPLDPLHAALLEMARNVIAGAKGVTPPRRWRPRQGAAAKPREPKAAASPPQPKPPASVRRHFRCVVYRCKEALERPGVCDGHHKIAIKLRLDPLALGAAELAKLARHETKARQRAAGAPKRQGRAGGAASGPAEAAGPRSGR